LAESTTSPVSTTPASTKPELTETDLVTLSKRSDALPKEIEQRTAALSAYIKSPIPDRISHLWRYSDATLFFPSATALSANRIDTSGEAVSIVSTEDEIIEKKVEMVPLQLSIRGLSLVGQAVSHHHGLLESLNGSLWRGGLYIRVPRNTALHHPIQLVHRLQPGAEMFRVVLEVEPGATADVVQLFEGGDAETRALSVSEIFVGQGATLSHAVVQQVDKKARVHVTVRANVERDGVFKETSLALGGALYKADLGASLIGIGAESEIVGVSFSDKKQQMDFHTVQHHVAENTRSNIHFKAALSGKSVSAYTGLIKIADSAKSSEAFQANRNLMLSDRARAHTIPELEIMNNDVQCSHAAVSAPLDEKELFYLMSRGISPPTARTMLVQGFFEDALSRIPTSLREVATEAVEERAKSAFAEEAK
jgi:Fe-S cluster assembly protein SufD